LKYLALITILFVLLPTNTNFAQTYKSQKRKEIYKYLDEVGEKLQNSESLPYSDSSSFIKFIFKTFFNKDLPRDSYSQFLITKNDNQFFPTNKLEDGTHDEEYLKNTLVFGDLLFWINTYNSIPDNRTPPISMVMMYFGMSKKKEMLMIGWGAKGHGAHDLKGGPDIYKFHPNWVMGCIRDENGNCVINGEFIGYGKVLDQNILFKKSKLIQ
jgi:hypothetical protein